MCDICGLFKGSEFWREEEAGELEESAYCLRGDRLRIRGFELKFGSAASWRSAICVVEWSSDGGEFCRVERCVLCEHE